MTRFSTAGLVCALAGASLIAPASNALACDANQNCTVNAWAFKKVLNHSCDNNSYYINETGALDVAQRAAAGTIDVDDYLYSFDKTCSHDNAITVGSESRAGTLNMRTYKRALFNSCHDNSQYVNNVGATGLAEKAAAGTVDVDNWLTAWSSSCSTDVADTVGAETRSGNMNMRAFTRAYGHSCDNNSQYINDVGATGAARDVAHGTSNLDNLLWAFDKTCDMDVATTVAHETNSGNMDMETFRKALWRDCGNNSMHITADGATQLARLAARGAINLRVFYDTWSSTCDFDTSKTVACAGQAPAALLGAQSSPKPEALALLEPADAKQVPGAQSEELRSGRPAASAVRAD